MIEVIIFVVSIWLTLLTHEALHWLFWRSKNVLSLTFKPYPHISDGRFYFGRVTYKIAGELSYRDIRRSAALPMVFSLVVSIIFLGLWNRADIWWAWIPALTQGLNLLWWWIGFIFRIPGSDGSKWINSIGKDG